MAGGDRDALGALYDRYAASVAGVARRFGLNDAEVEDLLHDVFLEIWGAAGEFDPAKGSVLTWLMVRVRSRALDRVRKATRRLGLLQESGESLHPEPVAPSPDTSAEHNQLRELVAQLDDDLRTVIDLAYFAGQSTAAMATKLEIPPGTVKSRLRRAREAIASLLAVPGGSI